MWVSQAKCDSGCDKVTLVTKSVTSIISLKVGGKELLSQCHNCHSKKRGGKNE